MSGHIAVIGAGVIGTGVAQTLAQAGHNVVLVDIDQRALTRAEVEIRRNVRLGRLLGASGMDDADVIVARIESTTDLVGAAAATAVIENVPERWAIKEAVHRQIDAVCKDALFVAANTSAIPITGLAKATTRPDRIIGMHFMNPVHLKPILELVPTPATSGEALEAAQRFISSIDKRAVVVSDSPGFVTNRILMLALNEAMNLVQEHVSTPDDVDELFRGCFGHPMGPFETADLIGLDNVLDTLDVLYANYRDTRYRPSPLLRAKVDAGDYGRKSGRGFYTYD